MTTEKTASLDLGVVIERREIDNRWQRYTWRPVAVFLGAPPVTEPKMLRAGDGWVQWHAATLPLVIHRTETEAYHINLASERPSVYVVLREVQDAPEKDYRPFLVTVSSHEALNYLEGGDDIVEGVPMDADLVDWLKAFVDRHHVDEPFRKRARKKHDPEEVGFGKPAPVDLPRGGGKGEADG